MIRSGAFGFEQLRRIRMVYLERRDHVIAGLRSRFGNVNDLGVDGGMHLTWYLPPSAPQAHTLQDHVLLNSEVGVYRSSTGPLSCFHTFDGWDRILLLGYPCLDRVDIDEALTCIAACAQRPEPALPPEGPSTAERPGRT